MNTFNSYNHKIQLTTEKESDGKISFLDVLIIREGKKIKTNWYQKPNYFGRLLNFFSHHPLNYKTNVINNLVDRGIVLAHITFHKENIQRIKTILLNNNYPINFIKQVINNSQLLVQKNTYTHQLSESNTNTHTYTHSTGQNPKNTIAYTLALCTRVL